jgi:hypothetical protein
MVDSKFLSQRPSVVASTSDMSSDSPQLFTFYNEQLGETILPKSSLLKICKVADAVRIVIKNLKMIPGYDGMKNDSEFQLRCACLIENLGISRADKLTVSKRDIFCQSFQLLFGDIPEDELQIILGNIEFLLEKRLVTKTKIRKRVFRFLKLNVLPQFFF